MDINLEPRYRNYWLDLARKEEKDKEEEAKKKTMATIASIIAAKARRKP